MRPWLSPPQLKSFPQDLVLVGRATVLIKVGATRRAAHAQPRALPSPLPDPSLWTPRAHEAKYLPARALSAGKPWHSRARARLDPLLPRARAAAGHRGASRGAVVAGARVGSDREASARAEGGRAAARPHALPHGRAHDAPVGDGQGRAGVHPPPAERPPTTGGRHRPGAEAARPRMTAVMSGTNLCRLRRGLSPWMRWALCRKPPGESMHSPVCRVSVSVCL